jgi:hypothetical protein
MTGITEDDFKRLARQVDAEFAAKRELAAPAPTPTPSPAAPGSIQDRQESILAAAAEITRAAEQQAQLANAARLVLSQDHKWAADLDDELALEALGLGPVDQAKLDSDARDAARRADPLRELRTKWFSLSEGQRREAASAANVDYEQFSAERLKAASGGRIFS